MMPEEFSGEIDCTGDLLIYRLGADGWTLPISSIRLIAEYTNSDGPGLDDYFLVFLTQPEGGWNQASFYAKGRDTALRALAKRIGVSLETELCYSTDYRTRIMWPLSAKGQPLMDVISAEKQSWLQKLTDHGARDTVLSKVARQVLEA